MLNFWQGKDIERVEVNAPPYLTQKPTTTIVRGIAQDKISLSQRLFDAPPSFASSPKHFGIENMGAQKTPKTDSKTTSSTASSATLQTLELSTETTTVSAKPCANNENGVAKSTSLNAEALVQRLADCMGRRLGVYANKEPASGEMVVRWLDDTIPLGGAWIKTTEFQAFVPHRADAGYPERLVTLRTKGMPCGLCGTTCTKGCSQCAQALCESCSVDLVMKIENPFLLACPFCREDMSWMVQHAMMTTLQEAMSKADKTTTLSTSPTDAMPSLPRGK